MCRAEGGAGAIDLARSVMSACEAVGKGSHLRFLYPLNAPIKTKIETITSEVYGAASVSYSEEAERKIARFTNVSA